LFWFVRSVSLWFARGHDFHVGTESGVFAFGPAHAFSSPDGSFRGYLL